MARTPNDRSQTPDPRHQRDAQVADPPRARRAPPRGDAGRKPPQAGQDGSPGTRGRFFAPGEDGECH